MKRIIGMAGLAVLVVAMQTVHAAVVETDDFNRAELGPNWSGDSDWSIKDSQYAYTSSGQSNPSILYQPVTLEAGSYVEFDFYIEDTGNYQWVNVGTFHDDGADNYYALEMRINNQGGQSHWRLGKYIDGVIDDGSKVTGGTTYFLNDLTWIHLRFETDNAGGITVELTPEGRSTVSVSTTYASPYTGGNAGLRWEGAHATMPFRVDNFEIQGALVPEPTTLGLLFVGLPLLLKRRK